MVNLFLEKNGNKDTTDITGAFTDILLPGYSIEEWTVQREYREVSMICGNLEIRLSKYLEQPTEIAFPTNIVDNYMAFSKLIKLVGMGIIISKLLDNDEFDIRVDQYINSLPDDANNDSFAQTTVRI